MTVSQIRELMMERVVPECLLPQNISACLLDEYAEMPELDAFTFLNRLRSLGIGSADFLYLLKGCGAPAHAVEKIEQHPDMNLQSLIVTLDGSGLTPKDYTRMLYVARQLWERTITMRLELDQEQPDEEQPEPAPEPLTARQKKPEPPAEPEKPLPRTAKQKKKNEPEFREYAGVKPIGKHDLPDGEERDIRTAVQLKPTDDEELPDDEEISEPPQDDPRGRRGSLIACGIGAALVCAADIGVGMLGFTAPEQPDISLHFAEDNAGLFSEIYKAYTGDRIGGENVQPLTPDVQVFGELLIDSGGQLGCFSSGNTVWTAEPDCVTVRGINGDAAEIIAHVEPPEGAVFLKVFQTESGITAVFTGDDSCGAAGIGESGLEWLSEQCGELTDVFFDGEKVRLGSVYTPAFSESFTIDDAAAYMPWTSVSGDQTVFQPGETAVTGTAQGCGYAVNAEYSLSGEVTERLAVLGDPVYSGAEFFSAVLRQDGGALLVGLDGSSELVSENIGEIVASAAGNGLSAAAEKSENGITVYVRDHDMNVVSAFTAGELSSMRFNGDTLLLSDGEKITMAVDLSDPSSPKPLSLTAANGAVNGEYALCTGVSQAGISLTLYHLEDGSAVQADSFSKTLTAAELKSLQFCGTNTMVVNGAECCGAAYSWFDGVSVVSEFSEMGRSRSVRTLYDDPEGYTAAVYSDNGLVLLCGSRVKE